MQGSTTRKCFPRRPLRVYGSESAKPQTEEQTVLFGIFPQPAFTCSLFIPKSSSTWPHTQFDSVNTSWAPASLTLSSMLGYLRETHVPSPAEVICQLQGHTHKRFKCNKCMWMSCGASYQVWFAVVVQLLSHVFIFATPWTVAHQAPLFMGFSRQEYWSGLPFPSPQSTLTLGK